MIFTFNLSDGKKDMTSDEVMESMKPLMMLVFYFMDKVKRFRLSREAKAKADKNRSKVSTAEQLSLFSQNLKEIVQNASRILEKHPIFKIFSFFIFSSLIPLSVSGIGAVLEVYPCVQGPKSTRG